MAFQSAAGHTNLPNGVFSPVIYSKNVQKAFRKSSVIMDITNTDYFGEISNFGDSVKIIKEPDITVKPYARGTQVEVQDLVDEDFTLIVDRANYWGFIVDDIEKKQSHVNFESLATDAAGYRLKDGYDRDILGYMSGYEYNTNTGLWVARTTAVGTAADSTADSDELLASNKLTRASFVSGGSASDSIAVGVAGTYDATPLQILNRVNRIFEQKSVPSENRWVVVDPVFVEKLQDEDSKFMNADYQDGEQMSNGKIRNGKVRGMTMYVSNNLPQVGTGPATIDNNGSSANYGVIVAGHNAAVATAEQMAKTETFRSQDSFGDVVRGMHLYGRKILRPESLIRVHYNINA